MAAVVALWALLLGAPLPAAGEAVWHEVYQYHLDIPEGWYLKEASNLAAIAFADAANRAVLQVFAYQNDRFADVAALQTAVQAQFRATGDAEQFVYLGRDAVFADYQFNLGRITAQGYFIMIDGSDYDFVLAAYAPADYYATYHDFLLSALDSFALGAEARLFPGPVSQYYHAFPAPEPTVAVVPFGEDALRLVADPGEPEAAQVVIEREARILAQYQQAADDPAQWQAAWHRYYRFIFRDNYQRLTSLAPQLDRLFRSQSLDDYQIAARLLSWLQGFEYERTGSLSDLQAPITCMVSVSGDCDSLGLAYIILLQYFEIDSVLMVSVRHSHALVGVDVRGAGARYAHDGTDYLVAELTAPVAIGLIDQSMADPADWIAFDLRTTY